MSVAESFLGRRGAQRATTFYDIASVLGGQLGHLLPAWRRVVARLAAGEQVSLLAMSQSPIVRLVSASAPAPQAASSSSSSAAAPVPVVSVQLQTALFSVLELGPLRAA